MLSIEGSLHMAGYSGLGEGSDIYALLVGCGGGRTHTAHTALQCMLCMQGFLEQYCAFE